MNKKNKQILMTIINISLASFSLHALSAENSNYYQDHNGHFIGYTSDGDAFPYMTDNGSYANINRDNWNGFINGQGEIVPIVGEVADISAIANTFYYKTPDCSGTRYVELSSSRRYNEAVGGYILRQSPNTKKIQQYTIERDQFSLDDMDDLFGDKAVSQSIINANGQSVCTEAEQQVLRTEWDQAINATDEELNKYGEEISYTLDRIADLVRDQPLVLAKVSNESIDITHRYPWMGFRIDEKNNVTAYIKSIDISQPIDFINIKNPPKPPQKVYPRTSHEVTVHVRYNNDLSYVNVTQGPDIAEGQITVNKQSKGIYDITFPETYVPKEGDVNVFQLLCSVNSGATTYSANTTIGCHKLEHENIIRVTTNLKGKPFNSDFSLNIQH